MIIFHYWQSSLTIEDPLIVSELLLVPRGNFIVAIPSSFYETVKMLLSYQLFFFDSVKCSYSSPFITISFADYLLYSGLYLSSLNREGTNSAQKEGRRIYTYSLCILFGAGLLLLLICPILSCNAASSLSSYASSSSSLTLYFSSIPTKNLILSSRVSVVICAKFPALCSSYSLP